MGIDELQKLKVLSGIVVTEIQEFFPVYTSKSHIYCIKVGIVVVCSSSLGGDVP